VADLVGGGDALIREPRKEERVHDSIICGVDGSPDLLRALRTAAKLARRLDARLIAAHVADPLGAAGGGAGAEAAVLVEQAPAGTRS
jgi:nucleotide-binding universal stress UspA family protein